MMDLAIYGQVFADGALKVAWVSVQGGKIAKVSHELSEDALKKIELKESQLLLPAAVDAHTHLRDWAQEEDETIETGTKAALAGGITVTNEMSNTKPRIDSAKAMEDRIKLHQTAGYTDFAISAKAPPEASGLPELKEKGTAAIKFFSFDLYKLPAFLPEIRKLGLKTHFHTEEESFRATLQEKRGETYGLTKILRLLPPDVDAKFELSSADSVDLIVTTKPRLPKVGAEGSPDFLFMSEEIARARIGIAKAESPPLRSEENLARMQEHMRRGNIDYYASAHHPHTTRGKINADPIPKEFSPKRGFSTLEIAYPVLLSKTRNLALACELFCEKPARYLGVRKGLITPGYDADFVIMSLDGWTVQGKNFVSRGKVTPFEGEHLDYRVETTFLRGEVAYGDGKFNKLPISYIKGVYSRGLN